MKFGVREICDVVLRRKAAGWFGKLYLEKDMPVLYFDTLKTSNLEGAATTVYAQGGKGNPRLVAWEGDRTVTFTMEDALISPQSFSILSGAGFMDASSEKAIYVHQTGQLEISPDGNLKFETKPSAGEAGKFADMYLMLLDEYGNINTNFMPIMIKPEGRTDTEAGAYAESYPVNGEGESLASKIATFVNDYNTRNANVNGFQQLEYTINETIEKPAEDASEEIIAAYKKAVANNIVIGPGTVVFVDYYVKADTGVKQIDIEADKFGGSYYLEASTLFRDQGTGEDHPAEFVIPNCKVQSNFTFTMAPSGDPSTFTFTMDAFPDYTKFDRTKKVLAALQIVEDKAGFGALTAKA